MLHIIVAVIILMLSLYFTYRLALDGVCAWLVEVLPDEEEEERMWASMKEKRPLLWHWLRWMR